VAEAVLAEVADGIGIITINRPEARNAVNEAVARSIAAHIDEFDTRSDVTSLIITGAGGTFCAGMDLKASRPGRTWRDAFVGDPVNGVGALRIPARAVTVARGRLGSCPTASCETFLASRASRPG
jgi:enoyl-CoA hydratase/carnithine racemase